MHNIRPIISLWCAVLLFAAVLCGQSDAINLFFSDINHHCTRIESTNPDSDIEETKQLGFVPDYVEFIPFFEPPSAESSCSGLLFLHPPVPKSVFSAELHGRAPPA